jgi:hypothetical protein
MGDMSSTAPGPRPREVTIGGWAIPVASAILVVVVFDRMAGLHSVATRDALTTALASGWAKGVGITVDDAITLVRAALFVSGTAAAITGILGIFVLQRHASARLALTVAAVPVVLTAPVVGGLLGIIIGISTGLLWTRPARDWFAGRPPAPREVVRRQADPVPLVSERWSHDGSATPPQGPPPPQAWVPSPGSPQPGPPAYPAPYPAPFPTQYPAQDPAQDPAAYPSQTYLGLSGPQLAPTARQVPTPVRIACILTWIFSLLTGGVYLVLILLVAVDRGEVISLLRDNASIQDTSLSDDQLIGMIVAMSAIALLWCLAASLLAFLTWRRHAWAWILLLVSIGVAGLFELFALPFSLLHLAACVTAFVLLLRAPARAWISSGAGPRQPPSWPGGPAGGPPAHALGWPGQTWPPPVGQEPRPPVDPPVQYPPPPPPAQYPPPPPPEQPPVKPPVW